MSLYLLVLAESGERKSTVDTLFTEAVHAWERVKAQEGAKAMEDYEFAMSAWQAKYKGLLNRIRDKKKSVKTNKQED